MHPHKPYFIGGACVGGRVAYEIARQLDHEGEATVLLLLNAHLQTRKHGDAKSKAVHQFKWRIQQRWQQLQKQSPLAWLHYGVDKIQRYFDRLLNNRQHLQTMQYHQVRIHYGQLVSAHYPTQPHHGPTILLVSKRFQPTNPTDGWAEFLRGNIAVYSPQTNQQQAKTGQGIMAQGHLLQACLNAAQKRLT